MLKDGYHIATIPANSIDKLLSNTEFSDAWQAHCVAKTLSYYNRKVTQVIYCEAQIDKQDLVWVFQNGEEVKWY